MSRRRWRWSLLTFVVGVTILGAVIGFGGRYYLSHPSRTLYCVGNQRIYETVNTPGKRVFSDVYVCWKKQPLEPEEVMYVVIVPSFRGNWGHYGKGGNLQWFPFAGNSPRIKRMVSTDDGLPLPNDIGIFLGELWFNDDQVELDARTENNIFMLDFDKEQLVRVPVERADITISVADWKQLSESRLWTEKLRARAHQ